MKIHSLIEALERASSDTQRKQTLESALVLRLAYSIDLPNGKVESVEAFFSEYHDAVVKKVIDSLNEQFPISAAMVHRGVVSLYKYRYTLAFEPAMFSLPDLKTVGCTQVGNHLIPPTVVETCFNEAGALDRLLCDHICRFVAK